MYGYYYRTLGINMKSNGNSSGIQKVADVNGELADAIMELGLAECILDAGTEYDRASINETVLGYVELGLGPEVSRENEVFTVTHNLCGWLVKRERFNCQRAILGGFESPYGAVGEVRSYHPATTPLDGATPTYPKWIFEEINTQLADALEERSLTEYVVDVDIEEQLVTLSSNRRYIKLYLQEDGDRGWDVVYVHGCGFEKLETSVTLTEAMDRVEIQLS